LTVRARVALADRRLPRPRHHGLAVDQEAAVADGVEHEDLLDLALDLGVAVADAVALLIDHRHRAALDPDRDRDLLIRLHLGEICGAQDHAVLAEHQCEAAGGEPAEA
jgi:hypothetical protein